MCNIVFKKEYEMKHVIASLTIGACLLLPSSGVVFAASGTVNPNRPHVSCGTGSATSIPGNAGSSSTNSPFNPAGLSGMVYAGGPLSHSSTNPNAFAGYDVACLP